ncbi:hypothetical protein IAW_05983 [Bacillus cereus str. Schrouff]|uniref:hypothetical protein n=1 Tax=Bacillus cereus TaxID=1396 RepID=UPI00032DF0C8|nr:hypothetical protein [Bacillus cereus]EOO04779.1 hypothetical protein IAW_05983 [Bacillus cereus str. Schrouff]EOO80803.1 hypothetical protein IGY_06169 [Bacillus cereus K-5975c]
MLDCHVSYNEFSHIGYRSKACIYKRIQTNQYWHVIVPVGQNCPWVTGDSQLVYEFVIPCHLCIGNTY